MAGMMMKVLCVAVACMVVATLCRATVTCNNVEEKLKPCLAFLKAGGAVPKPCCSGVQDLQVLADTTMDRQTFCHCMKTTYKSHPEIKINNAHVLPSKCGVKIAEPISPNTDCSKVK